VYGARRTFRPLAESLRWREKPNIVIRIGAPNQDRAPPAPHSLKIHMRTLTVIIVLLTVPRLISGHAEGERKSRWEIKQRRSRYINIPYEIINSPDVVGRSRPVRV
jgi:hypothetical protein